MIVSVRPAVDSDIARLVALYEHMEVEQTVRKPIWALTDGLDEPLDISLSLAIDVLDSHVLIGEIDGVCVGFLWATVEPTLERSHGATIGRIRLIFTEEEARGVGVGHTMLVEVMETLRSSGIRLFDAPVGPGQRAAKNFFESHGFAARSITMHSADPAGDEDA